jgi:hypothetical protein
MDCLAAAVPRTAVHWVNDHWAEITDEDKKKRMFPTIFENKDWGGVTAYLNGEASRHNTNHI